jgi:hypothetical protein
MKKIHLAILNFNTVTVNLHVIEKKEVKKISTLIGDDSEDSIVLEFMKQNGYKESECQYMISGDDIPVFSDDEIIFN